MPYNVNLPIAGISLLLLGLAACQPAQVSEESSSADPAANVASAEVTAVEVVTVSAETTADAQTDHDHGEHDHDAHDDDVHDHDEHDHDKHDHETAGGEAHVHGHADLAITVEGDRIQVSLISPLANFGLSESNPQIDDLSPYGASIVEFVGGDCSQSDRQIKVESDGQHGYMSADLSYSCADISAVEAANVTVFDAYSGFEEIDAVLLTEDDQVAQELTPSAHTLSFP